MTVHVGQVTQLMRGYSLAIWSTFLLSSGNFTVFEQGLFKTQRHGTGGSLLRPGHWPVSTLSLCTQKFDAGGRPTYSLSLPCRLSYGPQTGRCPAKECSPAPGLRNDRPIHISVCVSLCFLIRPPAQPNSAIIQCCLSTKEHRFQGCEATPTKTMRICDILYLVMVAEKRHLARALGSVLTRGKELAWCGHMGSQKVC